MDTSEQYIKMCSQAPGELVWAGFCSDFRDILYCTYHKVLPKLDYQHCWYCPGMEESGVDDIGWETGMSVEEVVTLYKEATAKDDWCENKCWIRLPQQDQLQEIWWEWLNEPSRAKPSAICQEFYYHWLSVDVRSKFKFTSMEQLWLAFVMQRKYSKVWNGEEWVDRDTS